MCAQASPPSVSSPEPPAASPADRVYPAELKTRELAALHHRRRALLDQTDDDPVVPESGFPPDTVGVAFSGGGIRSATFCLGVIQALARKRLLGKIDYLSTVSGGGYLGSFYGAWLNRGRDQAAGAAGFLGRMAFWRRDFHQGKPQAGHFAKVEAGLADADSFPVFWLRQNGRYLTPNGAGDAVLAAAVALRNWLSLQFVLGVFLLLLLAVAVVFSSLIPSLPVSSAGWLCPSPESDCFTVRWSPWFVVVLVPLALGVLLGAVYWLPWLSARGRNRFSRFLAISLAAAAGLGGLALLDTAGGSLWTNKACLRELVCNWIWETGGTAAVLLLLVRKAVGLLRDLASTTDKMSVPMNVVITLAALAIAGVWLVALSTAAHGLTSRWPVAGVGVLLVLALIASHDLRFANLSSLANLYGARLTRAYLGASNPCRRDEQKISETVPGDDVDFETYSPDEAGGPLHLINVTVNETVDGRTETEQFDRKGFSLALGPVGISAGATHHALWIDWQGRPRGGVRPVPHEGFHCLADAQGEDHAVQQLNLGQWVGVSGAAFSTGLGARTNPALSFLCGFFNIRLGLWWDSGVKSYLRPAARTAQVAQFLRQLPSAVFPTQVQLLNEFRARFYGSARQHWYLSDGGHFENTATYELVRRRLPFIILCDDGCDPDRQMEDFANLVRKARIDFNAEVTTLTPTEAEGPLGTFEQVTTVDEKTRRSPKAALLARVRYLDGESPDSLILLLKPTVTGREPVDVLNYQTVHPDFPQQTTMDQFFDEEQWESYRKLGEVITAGVFAGTGPDTDLRTQFASQTGISAASSTDAAPA